MERIEAIKQQIAKDICKNNATCSCEQKDGHCRSIMAIAENLAKQGYKPPDMAVEHKEGTYINTEEAYGIGILTDWYINSVSDQDEPKWTPEHLEELLNDFYVIPTDTPTVDAFKVIKCRDCGYRTRQTDPEHGRTQHYCTKNKIFVTRDFFCGYAEITKQN